MIVDYSRDELVDMIGDAKFTSREELSMEKTPECFKTNILPTVTIPYVLSDQYLLDKMDYMLFPYDMCYLLEEGFVTANDINTALIPPPKEFGTYIASDVVSILFDMSLNALWWGNEGDSPKDLVFDLQIGEAGSLCSVTDSGSGFDYKDMIEKRIAGELVCTHAGRGFDRFVDSLVGFVSYHGKGNEVSLFVPGNESIYKELKHSADILQERYQ